MEHFTAQQARDLQTSSGPINNYLQYVYNRIKEVSGPPHNMSSFEVFLWDELNSDQILCIINTLKKQGYVVIWDYMLKIYW